MCQILERMQCEIISVLMSSKIGHTPFNLEMLVIVYSVSAQKQILTNRLNGYVLVIIVILVPLS